jgi:hypothetical protein
MDLECAREQTRERTPVPDHPRTPAREHANTHTPTHTPKRTTTQVTQYSTTTADIIRALFSAHNAHERGQPQDLPEHAAREPFGPYRGACVAPGLVPLWFGFAREIPLRTTSDPLLKHHQKAQRFDPTPRTWKSAKVWARFGVYAPPWVRATRFRARVPASLYIYYPPGTYNSPILRITFRCHRLFRR